MAALESSRRHLLQLMAAAAASPAFSPPAAAQSYPNRPIHFIVAFPAGSPNEVLARLYGEELNDDWHQPVVVELRPGATGTIGAELVARAAPDGYTLLLTVDLPITMAPALVKVNYDPLRDFIPIAMVANSESVVVVGKATGIRSMADLVAAARAKPATLTFASAGHGSPAHLCGEMIKRQAGIDLVHVPYTGVAPGMNAVLAGSVTMLCGPINTALPFIKAGSVNALGVTGTKPSPLLPGIAPLSEQYPGLTMSAWFGLFAPAGTPAAICARLHDEFKKIFADAKLADKLRSLGLDPEWMSGSQFRKRVADDVVKWRDFVAAAKIKVD